MPNVQKGIRAAEQRAEEQGASGFYRVKTVKMADGDGPWYYRIVTDLDDMVVADMHVAAETKLKPEQYKGSNWPKAMSALCMLDRMFRVYDADGRATDEYEPGYGDCYLHNRDRGKLTAFKRDKSLPDTQTFALAVAREPILDPVTKRPKGFRDYEDEFRKEDGTLVKIPRFVIISQKHRNFWSGLEAAIFMGDAPVGAYDFKVTRKGNDYTFSPTSADPVLYPGSEDWARYTDNIALIGFNLDAEILRMGEQDWYDRWFVEGAVPKDGYGKKDDSEDGGTDGGTDESARPDPEKVAAFASQLKTARNAVQA